MSGGALRYQRPRHQREGAAGQGRLPLTAERRGMLAKVAIGRKQLGLDEDAYRDLVQRVAGVRSSAQASDADLHRLVAELVRLGFKPSKRRSARPQVRMIYGIWGDLQPYLADPTAEALRAFVQRQTGLSAPEFLDADQGNKVVEALKAWLARERRKAGVA